MLTLAEVEVGSRYVEMVVDNLTRTQIVQYAGASGDFNPVHTDEVFATKVAGYPSVFAHGMLTMGLSAKALTNYAGVHALQTFGVRFRSQVWPGDSLTTALTVTEVNSELSLVTMNVVTTNQYDEIVLDGTAVARCAS